MGHQKKTGTIKGRTNSCWLLVTIRPLQGRKKSPCAQLLAVSAEMGIPESLTNFSFFLECVLGSQNCWVGAEKPRFSPSRPLPHTQHHTWQQKATQRGSVLFPPASQSNDNMWINPPHPATVGVLGMWTPEPYLCTQCEPGRSTTASGSSMLKKICSPCVSSELNYTLQHYQCRSLLQISRCPWNAPGDHTPTYIPHFWT